MHQQALNPIAKLAPMAPSLLRVWLAGSCGRNAVSAAQHNSSMPWHPTIVQEPGTLRSDPMVQAGRTSSVRGSTIGARLVMLVLRARLAAATTFFCSRMPRLPSSSSSCLQPSLACSVSRLTGQDLTLLAPRAVGCQAAPDEAGWAVKSA